MLAVRPPDSADTSLRRGDSSWSVYGLQSALNTLRGAGLAQDGSFGAATETAVVAMQRALGLTADGVAGPATQGRTIRAITQFVTVEGVPVGLGRGMNEGEGGPFFGSVNWAVAGGVDCGIVQRRVFEPYTLEALRNAFAPAHALRVALLEVRQRAESFAALPWASVSRERAMRCAIMAHNWPAGALSIAKTGRCSSPDAIATWVPAGVRFDDGTPVRTRWEWCQFYAMGSLHGPARIPRYVTSW